MCNQTPSSFERKGRNSQVALFFSKIPGAGKLQSHKQLHTHQITCHITGKSNHKCGQMNGKWAKNGLLIWLAGVDNVNCEARRRARGCLVCLVKEDEVCGIILCGWRRGAGGIVNSE
jgi:hypothetical protein